MGTYHYCKLNIRGKSNSLERGNYRGLNRSDFENS